MPVSNHERQVSDAIKSILNQTFRNFELILAIYGSADHTLYDMSAFSDQRIRIIADKNFPDRTHAWNAGLDAASGKYVAIMDADHIMHVDRLKIQHALMEAEPSITVCSSRVAQLGNKNPQENAPQPSAAGWMENPLLAFLQGNCILHPTVMIRNQFLKEHRLRYEDYPDAEDFKLWTEIAKRGGNFYVDTQSLLYCHATNHQENKQQLQTSETFINEIVEFLAKRSPELDVILKNFKKLKEKEMMTQQDIVAFFHNFFMKNKDMP